MTIVIPYRNRPNHLAQFIPHMKQYLPDARIVIMEQAEGKPFNRGKLINCSYLETLPSCFCSHDVDMLGIRVDYSFRFGVTQLAGSDIQRFGYLGGVTMYDAETFERTGGYHNDYFHRAEDNEMNFNLHRLQIPVKYRIGNFRYLPHLRTGPEFIPELWEKAQRPREVQDQLSACEYRVISRKECETHTHIIVDI